MSRFILIGTLLAVLSACDTPNLASTSKISQLQMRQFQVREFAVKEISTAMNAVLQALMDEGFSVTDSDVGLGLIIATKSQKVADPALRNSLWFYFGFIRNYPSAHILRMTVSLKNAKDITRVRLGLTEDLLNEHGGIINSRAVADQLFYQRVFSKIDKAMFLEKHHL
jgi:hypothetical protein